MTLFFFKKRANIWNNIPNSKLKWRRRWTTTTTTTQIIYTRSPKWMTMLFIMLNHVYHHMVGKQGKEKSTPQLGQKKLKKKWNEMKASCPTSCRLKCTIKISEEERHQLNNKFNELSAEEKKCFYLQTTGKNPKNENSFTQFKRIWRNYRRGKRVW